MIHQLRKFSNLSKLNILTFPTHESYQTCLSATGHEFYLYHANGIKVWEDKYRPLPQNHHRLDGSKGIAQLPADVDFDLVLSQNKFGQFQIAHDLSQRLQIPLISLEHTLPMPGWDKSVLYNLGRMRGHTNVCISEFSQKAWGIPTDIIHHGIDTDFFKPTNEVRKQVILSVVNDWIMREWCCNFSLWKDLTQGLQVNPVGDTPGLSKPASSPEELVHLYNTHIFINTSSISPVPTALLEAMSCGAPCVTSATCMIPEIIENGKNGFMSNDPKELRYYLELCISNPDLCKTLGENARKTIEEKFSLGKFVGRWNEIFWRTFNEN